MIFLCSCNKIKNNNKSFEDVDFTGSVNVQIIANQDVYNTEICFVQNEIFSLKLKQITPPSLEDLRVEVENSLCKIFSNDLIFEKNINDFNDDFFPKIVYFFFASVNFENDEFIYNQDENAYILSRKILSKTVVFTVQNNEDNSKKAYLIEVL